MKIGIETSRGVAQAALRRYMKGEEAGLEASIAKVHASRIAIANALDMIQIFGSHGFSESDLSDFLLSGVGASIGGGTEEMQREMIYQSMYLAYRRTSWEPSEPHRE